MDPTQHAAIIERAAAVYVLCFLVSGFAIAALVALFHRPKRQPTQEERDERRAFANEL